MLRGTIDDSPSLLTTVGKVLDQAYQSVLLREVLRGHKKPDSQYYRSATSPWPTMISHKEGCYDQPGVLWGSALGG